MTLTRFHCLVKIKIKTKTIQWTKSRNFDSIEDKQKTVLQVLELFVEMFRANIHSLIWIRLAGVSLWCTNMAAGK